jgi:hypothetical protein
MRFYGRGAKGNRVLSESEVAALYARREKWEVDRERLLDSELDRAPQPNPRLGYVVAFARPVVPGDLMVDRVASSREEVLSLLLNGASRGETFGRIFKGAPTARICGRRFTPGAAVPPAGP